MSMRSTSAGKARGTHRKGIPTERARIENNSVSSISTRNKRSEAKNGRENGPDLLKFWFSYKEYSARQTWVNPLLILVVLVGIYLFGDQNSSVHKELTRLMTVSYHIEGTDQYGKGENDFYYVGFYALFLTVVREISMCCLLRPAAHYFGIKEEKKVDRFMEQTYSMLYFGLSSPIGLWVMSRGPLWFFETTPFYTDYPHRTHDWYFKAFYLGQAASWVQQSVALISKFRTPRKDFYELLGHHTVTIALIWLSYRFHFTWMGLEIYITMDVSDFFLSASKTLIYLGSPFARSFFVLAVSVWVYLRHWVNLRILWSVLTEFRSVGEWEANLVTQQYKCWISQPIVFALIFALQVLNAYWSFLIFRILHRYIVRGVDTDEEEEKKEVKAKKRK